MNNHPLHDALGKSLTRSKNVLPLLLCLFTSVLIFTTNTFAQTQVWQYVTTLPGGIKSYLNDEVKVLPSKKKTRWEKVIKADGSSATALVEWDCSGKLRLTRQITFYNSDQSVVGTKKKGFDWSPVIPGSAADFLYYRVCLPATPVIWADIISDRTALRLYPEGNAQVLRTAKRGERFQIVPETGKGGWFNVVDEKTQEDYWLPADSFELIVSAPPKAATAAVKLKSNSIKKRKPTKLRNPGN
jgi:hypothetical protein